MHFSKILRYLLAFPRAVVNTLKSNEIQLAFYYKYARGWADRYAFSYYAIFTIIAPELMIENSVKNLAGYIGLMLKPQKEKLLKGLPGLLLCLSRSPFVLFRLDKSLTLLWIFIDGGDSAVIPSYYVAA